VLIIRRSKLHYTIAEKSSDYSLSNLNFTPLDECSLNLSAQGWGQLHVAINMAIKVMLMKGRKLLHLLKKYFVLIDAVRWLCD